MAIPGPGTPIDITDIVTEFGGTAPHGLSEYYRGGGAVGPANTSVPTSGAIALGNFYGTQNRVALSVTISGSTNNYDLYTIVSANPAYSAGNTDVTLTVNPGVTVSSTSTGTYALSIPSSFNPADGITLVNNGTIIGRGGNGGHGGDSNPGFNYNENGDVGGNGGNALYINRPVSINNVGTLAGGGGGGGGGGSFIGVTGSSPKTGAPNFGNFPGPGGGGGAGVNAGSGGPGGNNPSNPAGTARNANPGASGSSNAGGAGGAAHSLPNGQRSGIGGAGGGRGANGSASIDDINAPGKASSGPVSGGTTGKYLVGNPYATWVANGTRQGAVS